MGTTRTTRKKVGGLAPGCSQQSLWLWSGDAHAGGRGAGAAQTGGSLKPRMNFPGKTNITIRIEKIQLKDPSQFLEPYFTVSVKGAADQTRRRTCCRKPG